MKWHFSIWFSLGILFSPIFLFAQENPLDFQGLKLGMTYNQVLDVLKKNKVFLKTEQQKFYSLSMPIYDLLDIYDSQSNIIDKEKMRIYYDDEVFFDLRNLIINDDNYNFFYKSPYYIMDFTHISSYEVAYASRLNSLLYSLWVKFFNNKLYAMEYKVTLSPLELNRLKNNYFKRYGRILTPGVQVVERNGVTVIVSLDRQDVTITRIDKNLRNQIFDYLDGLTADVLKDIYQYIHNLIKDTKNAKLFILEDKKQKLRESLSGKYHFIDEL